ncbi:MAG: DUF3293 domain-containing protein [Coraliomargaritaceae bacterium]
MILPEYLSTRFLLPKSKLSLLKEWPNSFWIITACNPYSSGDRSNDERNNLALKKDLEALSSWLEPIICTSDDGGHDPEPSFAVNDLTHNQIQELADKYKQNAVFFIESDLLSVISCTEKTSQAAGKFCEKVKPIVNDT